ncbi:nascent polypeptide-associated complex subunit alpha, muscle-specific form-like [Mauremys reevesii]|uniref:nascent polypeptide-associated complex subunit alpha, muscle-specific form-like n=1 Tax=Mauremys reevesii TaxID=260615 RepID=UPI00193FE46A|nr:nascent polypeptide-associated complex subunit alpha, muscle-specific form-like [Mauremys reevesii]
MGSFLPLLALLGAAGGAGSLEERESCGGIIDVISAANGTIHLPAVKGPLAPTRTCTWVIAALPSEAVRVEIKAPEAAAHPNLSVRFEGSPGEGAGREGPVDIAHSFLLKGQGRTVIRGSLDSSLTFTYWVVVDWCARLALCCSVVGSAQTCLCPGNSTGERCRTGVDALESLREGVGQVASQEATVKLRGAVLSAAAERLRSTSTAAPGTRLALHQSPAAWPAGTAESPGDALSNAAPVPRGPWLGRRRNRPLAQEGAPTERVEPPVTAAAAEHWEKARDPGVRTRPSAAAKGTPAGRTDSPLFSARSQFKAANPTSVPLPGTVPLGNLRAKEPTSLGGSSSDIESPTVSPGSAARDRAPSSTSAVTEPVYPSGESVLTTGPSDPEPWSMETPDAALALSKTRTETSRGRAAGAQKPVTLLPPSVPVASPAPRASAGGSGAQHFGGGKRALGTAHREAAVTAELDFTDLGLGARLPSPTEGSGTLLRGQTELAMRAAASTPCDSLETSQTPALQPNGRESLTWRPGGKAQPATETGGTPVHTPDSGLTEPLATTARSAPGLHSSTPRRVPLGSPGPEDALGHTLVYAGSEKSPGHRGVDGVPKNMDLSPSSDVRTEGDPQAVSWAESLPGASPDRMPSVYAGTPRPLGNLTAPAPSPGSAQPPAPAEQLSTGAGVSHPTAAGQEIGGLSEHAPEPSLSTPAPALEQLSSAFWTPAWLPETPAERPREPGTGESRSTVSAVPGTAVSVGTSSQPPVSRTHGAKQPSLAPAPVVAVTTQEGVFPGASSGDAVPHGPGTVRATTPLGFQPPPASQPAGAATPAATLQRGSTALSPTEPPDPHGTGLSSPFPFEKDVSGSAALGLAELSLATTQSPSWDTATTNATVATSSLASASWRGGTERLGQWVTAPPAWATQAGSELGNSSQATDATPPSGAGGSFPSSSPTPPIPELTLTSESAGAPAGSRRPWPPLAATSRAWGAAGRDPVSSARMHVPFASTQLRAAMPPVTPGPAGVTDGQPPAVTTKGARGRAQSVFVVEDQPPLLKATLLRVPCELALEMDFVGAFQTPASHAHRSLVQSFNETVAPLFAAVPGFQRLEVTRIREGSVVLEYDALFAAERLRGQAQGLGALLNRTVLSGATRSGLHVASAPVLWNVVLERQLDLCTMLFSCHAGFECISSGAGNASCTSMCHRDYCKNHGICTHAHDHEPVCQCPTGSDYWFMGPRCDYKVTQQSLLGVACGVLLSVALLGVAVACLVLRRFKALLLEARVDQTKSSYRRFCRLDDVSAQYWSQSWLASANSLDNPGFSNSEELLHLQMLDNSCCSCKDDTMVADSYKQRTTPIRTVCRPSFHYDWDTSSSSINDPMIDSGKASDISVSSWPMEPVQWTPFPILHPLSRQRPPKASRRPHSYCEGMELVNLERSWTA